ncbi:hypothetical protein IMZ48_25050 [Candidatus Bathyarchaeota archaeon]|nr:hypothetical protein [Candidatus Bathyarchaeota archaeon]
MSFSQSIFLNTTSQTIKIHSFKIGCAPPDEPLLANTHQEPVNCLLNLVHHNTLPITTPSNSTSSNHTGYIPNPLTMASNVKQPVYSSRVPPERLPLQRHEILHRLRAELEGRHRELIHRYSTRYQFLYEPRIDQLDDLPQMGLGQADDSCNKTAPIYIYSTADLNPTQLLLIALHNWLYRKWFRPYKSEIEWGQFIAKVMRLPDVPKDMPVEHLVNSVVSLNGSVCDKVEAARQSVMDFDLSQHREGMLQPATGIDYLKSMPELIEDQEFFLLQPLFRAVVIMIDGKDYGGNLGEDVTDMGLTDVHIVRTGVEDGLSAPITFDAIVRRISGSIMGEDGRVKAVRTTLDTAFSFLCGLERREVAAFGAHPDPCESTKGLRSGYMDAPALLYTAKELGWAEESLELPSSKWVDADKYPGWTGPGADCDSGVMCELERRERGRLERRRAQYQGAVSGAP